VFLAIDAVDRQDWFLENMLVLGLMVLLLTTYRHFPLSDLSYILTTISMTLHAIGAHYTYSKVPLGFWVQDMWALDRNHFDRLAHFSFGLLLALSAEENVCTPGSCPWILGLLFTRQRDFGAQWIF